MAGALVLAWAGQAGITLGLNCQTGGTCGKRESISRTRGHVGAWDPALKNTLLPGDMPSPRVLRVMLHPSAQSSFSAAEPTFPQGPRQPLIDT